jgi:hypothetical protein
LANLYAAIVHAAITGVALLHLAITGVKFLHAAITGAAVLHVAVLKAELTTSSIITSLESESEETLSSVSLFSRTG